MALRVMEQREKALTHNRCQTQEKGNYTRLTGKSGGSERLCDFQRHTGMWWSSIWIQIFVVSKLGLSFITLWWVTMAKVKTITIKQCECVLQAGLDWILGALQEESFLILTVTIKITCLSDCSQMQGGVCPKHTAWPLAGVLTLGKSLSLTHP